MSVHAESSSAARPKARKAVHPADVQHATDAGLDLLRVIGRLVLHNVSLSNRSDLVIDHVVAGPSGVYVINTVAPTGSVTMSSGLLVCAGQPMMDEIHEVAAAAALLRDLLSGAPVAPILCFQRSSEVAGVVGEVAVCSTENILELLSGQPDVVDTQAQRAVMRVLSGSLVQVERREQKPEPEQPSKPRHRQKVRMLRRSHPAEVGKSTGTPLGVPERAVEPAPPEAALAVAPPVPLPQNAVPAPPPTAAVPEIVFPTIDAPCAEEVVETRVEFGVLEALVAGYAPPADALAVVPEIVFPTIDAPCAEEVVETRVEFGVLEALVAGYAPVVRLPVRGTEDEFGDRPDAASLSDDEGPGQDVVDAGRPAEPRPVESVPAESAPVESAPGEPARPVGRAPARPTSPVVAAPAARPSARLSQAAPPRDPVEESVGRGDAPSVRAATIWRSASAERPRVVPAASVGPISVTESAESAESAESPESTESIEPATSVPHVEVATSDPGAAAEQADVGRRRFALPRVDVRPALKKAGGVLAQLAPAEPVESVSALRETAKQVHEEPVVTEPAARPEAGTLGDAPTPRRFSKLLPAAITAVVVGAVLMASPEIPAAIDRGIDRGVDWGKGLFTDAPPPPVGSSIRVDGTAVEPAYDVTASGPVPVRTNGKVRTGHRLVAVKIRVHNDGTTKLTLPIAARLEVLDALGIGYPASTTVKRTNLGPSLPKVVTVGPGATLVGSVVFSVPKSRDVAQVQLALPDADADALAWAVATD